MVPSVYASGVATTHAGAVAFRETSVGREYLVISSSSGNEWVLPKGHIEEAESIPDAALRELMEESGVSGRFSGGSRRSSSRPKKRTSVLPSC
jgi:8-oxo-dGTP pyrophosphatase MutT (NUDIX family)